jgi:hypothetical protein
MKITICASVERVQEIKEIPDRLTAQGHDVLIPFYTQKLLDGEVSLEEYKRVKEAEGDFSFRQQSDESLIRKHFRKISNSDAIFVLNADKKGIANYIGGNTFLEMGFAHVLGKKIFLMNPLPEMHYSDELKEMDPIVLDSDLTKVR